MLFEQSKKPFSIETFRNPGACYRGAPFWSWNTWITKEMIEEQILQFKKMGMGGFHVHVRVGLQNQYMSNDFLELVRFCNEKAKENGMLCWLYDEDRYSSGIAGGEVTKNVSYRARWLKLTVHSDVKMLDSPDIFQKEQEKNHKVKGCFLRAYDVVLEEGFLKKASVISPEEKAEGIRYCLYLELAEESPWCNNQTYVDTLNAEAVGSFIETTHERYAKVLQEDFGGSVPAIFTDEPHINGLRLPGRAESVQEVWLPYTEALPERFREISGMDFFQAVPCLVWNRREERACPERYYYYETLCRMFTEAYCKQIGDWCEEHHLLSTGHLLSEDSLRGQACAVGEAMRCYKEFQVPGIDNLCDNREFMAVKQAASVAHQYAKEGVLSELYGVTQWDFDFEGYKLAGDWQAALGINVRVPHLAWASMNGEAKRDYPAAIGWQSPWYEDFSCIEDHFARVNYCLTRGKPVVHVAVLHTVESFWLLQSAGIRSEEKKKQLEEDFENVTRWLLTGGIDFDYVAESLLAKEGEAQDGAVFCCKDMGYEAVVVPSCINLRKNTVEKLLRFAAFGGLVLFAGEMPQYVDCRENVLLERLLHKSKWISLSAQALLDELDSLREVEFWEQGVRRAGNLLYQMRQEEDCRWLFVAQAYRGMEGRQSGGIWHRRALHMPQELEIRIRGIWEVEKYDTLSGEVCKWEVCYQGQHTVIQCGMYGDDSLLLRLKSVSGQADKGAFPCVKSPQLSGKMWDTQKEEQRYTLPEPSEYRMSEPNVLLLDTFEYSLDGKGYQASCEMLKLDNRLREELGLPLRCEPLAQPYIRIGDEVRNHILYLRTRIYSTAELLNCCLALEEAEHCTCTLNGRAVDMRREGYYVDPAIGVVRLPKILKGENVLCLTVEYGDCTNLEWMYLLGEFGVELQGAHSFLYPKPERLFWGDYTRQGFPFYTGNMTYLVELPDRKQGEERKDEILQVPYYSGAAVKAAVSEGEEQMLAFLPYACKLKGLKEQGNILEITCLGNRHNGFGQLHLMGDDIVWLGQNSWRTEGTAWTDTYQVKPMGILTAPQVIYRDREP